MRLQSFALLGLLAHSTAGHPALSNLDQRAIPLIPYRTYPDRSDTIREAFGVTVVDSLSTGLVMREFKVVDEILRHIPSINFDVTTDSVNLFETTIRYLGGLLSGYDLLKGPFSFRGYPRYQINALLRQAYRLAMNLQAAFDTPTGIPDNEVLFGDDFPRMSSAQHNGLAAIGTLVLEWTRLSDLTDHCRFGDLVHRAQNYLLYPVPQDEAWPGLLGNQVSLENGSFVDRNGGWGGETDSFYEYLIKMYIYDPVRFENYKDRWVATADSTIEHLFSRVEGQHDADWAFLSSYSNAVPWHGAGHLGCFAGGNLILGGLTLGEQKYINAGLAVTDGCRQLYNQTATGIGPEFFQWQGSGSDNSNNQPPADQADFARKAGFWITSGQYVLRPEVIESYYYAYRATGNPKYQDWAWEAFKAINKTCSAGSGFAGISDVNNKTGGGFIDSQESFWLAETLKYSYLLQADDWFEVQVQADKHGQNRWVYSTEGHPIRSPCKHEGNGFVCEQTCMLTF